MPTIELCLLVEISQVAQSAAQVNFGRSTFFLFCQAVKDAHLEVGLARLEHAAVVVQVVRNDPSVADGIVDHPTSLRSLRLRGALLSCKPEGPPGDLAPRVGKGSDIRHQLAQQVERDVPRKAPSLPRNTT